MSKKFDLKLVNKAIENTLNNIHKREDKDELQHIAYTEMVLKNDFKKELKKLLR